MHKSVRVVGLARRHWPELIHAGLVVLAFRIGLTILPYRKLKHWIPAPSGPRAADERLSVLMWAVHQSARAIPRASCLTQALAAQYLCTTAGHSTQIRIGVARNDDGRIGAHAWLMHDGRVLIGGRDEDLSRFTRMTDLGR